MRCPYCGHGDSKVIDSRPTEEGVAIRRRRECIKCAQRFTTYEKVESLPIVVIKKDKQTDEPLEDVTFNVYKDGKFITSVITDNAGYARISALNEGYYEIEEKDAPAGYICAWEARCRLLQDCLNN